MVNGRRNPEACRLATSDWRGSLSGYDGLRAFVAPDDEFRSLRDTGPVIGLIRRAGLSVNEWARQTRSQWSP